MKKKTPFLNNKVLIVGYGSIGRRHARNLMGMGIMPYILTRHPDKLNAVFTRSLDNPKIKNIEYCIISSLTARHLDDFKRCVFYAKRLKKILIEKPIEASYLRARQIDRIARKLKLNVFVAYNLRFLKVFDFVAEFIQQQIKAIKVVEVVAGQDLREWRPYYKDVRQSYSAYREQGGGVDLDLSHEIDYILWLFGNKFKHKLLYRTKISNLKINSPDIFKLILDYKNFIVDITLDYIRKPKERYLKIYCDNGKSLFYDFVTGILWINNRIIFKSNEIDESYRRLLRTFLDIDKLAKTKVCSVAEGLNVLKVLEV